MALFLGKSWLLAQANSDGSCSYWRDISEASIAPRTFAKQATFQLRTSLPKKYRTLYLNRGVIQGLLVQAPPESRATWESGGVEIKLPLPDGGFGRFYALNSPIMSPKLAKKYPLIQNYALQGIDDPSASGRLSVSPCGLQAFVFSSQGTHIIKPYFRNDPNYNISYFTQDLDQEGRQWKCGTATTIPLSGNIGPKAASLGASRQNIFSLGTMSYGQEKRIYRLAVACNGEFAQQVASGISGSIFDNAWNFINDSVARIVAIYERDLSVRFQLVEAEDQLIYVDPDTDPYSTYQPFSNDDVLAAENQSNIDQIVGSENYEFGHLFTAGTSTSGIAYGSGLGPTFGIIGDNNRKAMVISTRGSTDNQQIDFDLVAAHEMGHGSGANHVFNFSYEGTGAQVEPGSGSTIMSYAGIVSGYNLQGMMDDYFNAKSLEQITAYLSVPPGSLAYDTLDNEGNAAPVVEPLKKYTVPCGTPFALTAVATDINDDPLFYCWEQQDSAVAQNPTVAPRDNGFSPLFRSRPPTNDPTRYFPALKYILENTNVPPPGKGISPNFASGEFLPTTRRIMKFRVTTRDQFGGVAYADTVVESVPTAGPFVVTNPLSSATYTVGSRQAIGWAVKNTGPGSPINCTNVKISLSTDGGATFSRTLAQSVSNNGVFVFNMPNVSSTQVRFKVESVGNIFFDVNDKNITVKPSTTLYDNFMEAKSITFTNGISSNAGTTVGASTEFGEPPHFNSAGSSVWFKFVAPSNGMATATTLGSQFNTILAAYNGEALDGLIKIASNDDSNTGSGAKWSKINFPIFKNKIYYLALDGYRADAGPYLLTVAVVSPPLVENDNFDGHLNLGTAINFALTNSLYGATAQNGEPSMAGFPATRSVWFSWTAPANGEITLDTLGSPCDTVLGLYTGSVNGTNWSQLKLLAANDNAGVSTNISRLTAFVSNGVNYRIKVDSRSATNGDYILNGILRSNPVLQSPGGVTLLLKNIKGQSYQPLVAWNQVPTALRYEVNLLKSSNRINGLSTSNTNWTNGPLIILSNPPASVYGVQVRAISNNVSSPWSAVVPGSIAP